MKVLIPNKVGVASAAGGFRVKSACLNFSEVAQGRHTGLVPVKFEVKKENQVRLSAEKLVKVELTGEASDNNRGVRRVLLKVSLPYTRAVPDATGQHYLLDAASGGTISAHVVLSVPSRLRQDLLEQNDQVASQVASSNIALVNRLLCLLTGALGSTVSQTDGFDIAFDEANQFDELISSVRFADYPTNLVVDSPDQVFASAPADFATDISAGGGARALVKTYTSTQFGADGLSLETEVEDPGLAAAARDPITRGLFGLVPIEESSQIVQRTLVHT